VTCCGAPGVLTGGDPGVTCCCVPGVATGVDPGVDCWGAPGVFTGVEPGVTCGGTIFVGTTAGGATGGAGFGGAVLGIPEDAGGDCASTARVVQSSGPVSSAIEASSTTMRVIDGLRTSQVA
jgi:hypothetical protein